MRTLGLAGVISFVLIAAWAGCGHTLEHTVRAAIVEDALYETSTLSLLDGESLVAVPAEDAADLAALDEVAQERWRRATEPYRFDHTVVMPADGEPLAFWIVHERTGTATAILPDGSGGGVISDEEAELRRRIHYLEMLGKCSAWPGRRTRRGSSSTSRRPRSSRGLADHLQHRRSGLRPPGGSVTGGGPEERRV